MQHYEIPSLKPNRLWKRSINSKVGLLTLPAKSRCLCKFWESIFWCSFVIVALSADDINTRPTLNTAITSTVYNSGIAQPCIQRFHRYCILYIDTPEGPGTRKTPRAKIGSNSSSSTGNSIKAPRYTRNWVVEAAVALATCVRVYSLVATVNPSPRISDTTVYVIAVETPINMWNRVIETASAPMAFMYRNAGISTIHSLWWIFKVTVIWHRTQ